jgi:hypothetical protein
MRIKIAFLCVLATLIAPAMQGGTAPSKLSTASADVSSIAGIWRCQMEDLPAVTITVSDEEGSLSGAALFYLHRREAGQAVTATPGVPEPIFHPHFDGTTLTFEVSHRRAHPPETLEDKPITFELKLDGSDKAVLMNKTDHDPNAPVYILTRRAY